MGLFYCRHLHSPRCRHFPGMFLLPIVLEGVALPPSSTRGQERRHFLTPP